MHLVCRGESDKITLVLETGQPAVASNSWKFIYDRLADRTRTCWYDRAGYGHSESGEYVRRADIIAQELHELLTVSGELDGKRKVVIAGQSWGGILARVFQKMFPESVGGLVLIDATTEYTTTLDGQNKNITREDYIKEWRSQVRGIQILAITEAAGYTKVIFNLPAYYWSYYDKKNGGCQKAACYNPEAAADAFNNRFTLSAFSEMYYWSESEDILLANNQTYHSLGDLPVGVFTAGSGVNGTCEMGGVDIFLELGLTKDKDAYCADWNKNIAVLGPEHLKKQEMMSQLSNNTVWKVYWNARHNIQWDFPEELTQDIMDVVNKATKQ
jgi:pimeloyl-ACP methyl ester carboxylesterase